ncbi:hypothetical protein A1O3_07663 [Capronia epimyces CBS 606.96]|uniref:Uncharacterized protein n=1 Tax=Capronia epimyces CBS 606.96 TaxID=1182542 RepID=W9XLJ4_9EURO|nr:uncharacterized protein A1O3_07663 [Capronia epimyces CBS 606.96]EXJ81372.1 hypothetical protein A1O3_07663 [Capronia epimyces CBS 606.96]
MPTIKYLKDNEDDCDLDPQLYVSDLLLDEGKAAKDGADQRVAIKAILEQGRAVREGSVAVGSLLDNPQFRLQHQQTSRPPVPRFPGVSSSLGKRSLPPADTQPYPSDVIGSKRPRQIEIPETQREESVVSSIERDAAGASPELVQATQEEEARQDQDSRPQQSPLVPKVESPELWRSFQAMPAATADELEELPAQPHTFASRPRTTGNSIDTQRLSGSRRPNGVSSSAQIEYSQAPITPPTEASTGRSTSTKLRSQGVRDGTSIPHQRSSTSAGKFKRVDVYDFPESDIDDTQMSPRSKQARLGPRNSADRLSQIERLRSPNEDGVEEAQHRLSVDEALGALETESVLDGNGVAPLNFVTPEVSVRYNNARDTDDSEESIYEDAATDDIQMQDSHETSHLHKQPTPALPGPSLNLAPTTDDEVGDKENRHATPTSAQPVSEASGLAASSNSTEKTPTKAGPTPAPANEVRPSEGTPAKKRQRKKPSKINGDENSSQVSGSTKHSAVAETPGKVAAKSARKPRRPAVASSLDSPGEQLSQSLQESARKQMSANTLGKKQAAPSRAAGKKRKQDAAKDGPETAQTEPSIQGAAVHAKKTGTAPQKTPRQRKRAAQQKPSTTDEQSAASNDSLAGILVQRSETGADKSLPNAGSSPNKAADKQKTPVQDQSKALTDDKAADLIPVGFTEEEARTMKSREGMTKEQYEAEKKRKRQDAARQAAGQKKRGPSVMTDRPLGAKSETPGTAVASGSNSTGKKARKNASAEDGPKSSRKSVSAKDGAKPAVENTPSKATDDVVSNQRMSVSSANPSTASKRGSSKGASSVANSSKPGKSESGPTPATPGKTPTKSPSVQPASAAVSKPAKPDPKARSTASRKSTPAPAAKTTSVSKPGTKSASKSTPGEVSSSSLVPKVAAAPTIMEAKNLKGLHAALRVASQMHSASSSSLSRASSRPAPAQKRSVLNTSTDDDDDDDSSNDDSDDEAENRTKGGDQAKTQDLTSSSGSTSDEDNDDDDNGSEAGPKSKQVAQSSVKASPRKGVNAKTEVGGKGRGKTLGQPDPSIRDPSVDSDEDEDDEDDELWTVE